jgi:hypothetical protein
MCNAEIKRWSKAVTIPLLALAASMTSNSQELNPRPPLRKALVYHSATSAVCMEHLYFKEGARFVTVLRGVGSVVLCDLRFLFCSAFICFLASLGADKGVNQNESSVN